jgi:KDO2-lipid IV(A) lauroyltransferase
MTSFFRFLTAIAFFIGIFLIGVIPFRVLYLFSNFFGFLLHRVFSYRLNVITENLSKAYPRLSETDKRSLIRSIYRNISDLFVEGIKAFFMTHKQVVKRHRVLNPEIIEPYLNSGQSVLGLTGHIANWEWGSLSASGQINAKVVAFYKKLSNPIIDRFVRASRRKFGTRLASIENTLAGFEADVNNRTVFVMAADQNTIKRSLDIAYWIDFFGWSTPFLHGPEKYSKLFNLPIFYIDIRRVKRGFYEVEITQLVENPSVTDSGEITRIYARKLEEVIRRKPEDWLWSHRRWRYAKPITNA